MAKKEEDIFNEKSEKLKALQAAMSKIEKDYGKGSIMKLGDEHIEKVDVIPTVSYLRGEEFHLYPDFPTGGYIDVNNYKDGERGGNVLFSPH